MFKVTIKLDRDKVEEQNLDYDKVMKLVDQVYDRPEIIKTGEGRYTGITSSQELASFGVAMLTLERTDWFFDLISEWYMDDDKGGREDIKAGKLAWDARHQKSGVINGQ